MPPDAAPPATLGGTATALLEVIGPLQRTLRKRAREDWPLEPLATAQVELLRAVRGRAGISVGEAAAELRIAPNTASTLAQQLVTAGLISREPDPRDGRAVRLVTTPAPSGAWPPGTTAASRCSRRRCAGSIPDEQAALAAALPSLRSLLGGLS